MFLKLNSRWQFLAISLCTGFAANAHISSAWASTSTAEAAPPNQAELPWPPGGQEYSTYRSFKDDLLLALRSAQNRIHVASYHLSDGDIATAIFAAKLRGLSVSVLLDTHGTAKFASRHDYFRQNGVSLFLRPLDAVQMQAQTVIVIDGAAWALSTSLDERHPHSLRLSRSSYSLNHIASWFRNISAPRKAPEAATRRELPGAKGATGSITETPAPSVTIKDKQNQSQGAIPSRLPKETRLQRLRQGKTDFSESPGSRPGFAGEPSAPSNESDLVLDD